MNRFLRNGHGLLLAYDQGFEHGPSDFDAKNIDPDYILDIARQSQVFTGVIFQKGVAERYYHREQRTENRKQKTLPPLIIKLNGKTAFHEGEEPFAPLLCTVTEAIQLGASGVGYTVYVGSEREAEMMATLGKIVRDCNVRGVPTVAWMYLRGKQITNQHDPQKLAYAARLALEIGADAVKLQFAATADKEESVKQLKWIVDNAGKCKVFISGGTKVSDKDILHSAVIIRQAGAAGMAVGRNIWQRDYPVEFAKQIAEILYG